MPLRPRPGGWPAPVVAGCCLALLVIGILALGWQASDGSMLGDDLVKDTAWVVWLVVASASILVFALAFLFAVDALLKPEPWGLRVVLGRRALYLALATAFVGVLVLFQLWKGASPDIPVAGLEWRTRAVLWCGLVAAVPWLALVWLVRDECRLGDVVPATAPRAGQTLEPHVLTLDRLLSLWGLVRACVSAFAAGVVAAICTAGALRAAFLAAYPACEDVEQASKACDEPFPASNVLYYGAIFAVLLTIVATPMIVVWRRRARELVRRTYPLPDQGVPDDTWVSDRARLSGILGLDVPILRNPLIALSIFTPLITSTLAAFIPQLGS